MQFLQLQSYVREARGSQDNKLELWGDAPRYEYSSVPLMKPDGSKPVKNAKAGDRGHALMLNDKQVCIPSLNLLIHKGVWGSVRCNGYAVSRYAVPPAVLWLLCSRRPQ